MSSPPGAFTTAPRVPETCWSMACICLPKLCVDRGWGKVTRTQAEPEVTLLLLISQEKCTQHILTWCSSSAPYPIFNHGRRGLEAGLFEKRV